MLPHQINQFVGTGTLFQPPAWPEAPRHPHFSLPPLIITRTPADAAPASLAPLRAPTASPLSFFVLGVLCVPHCSLRWPPCDSSPPQSLCSDNVSLDFSQACYIVLQNFRPILPRFLTCSAFSYFHSTPSFRPILFRFFTVRVFKRLVVRRGMHSFLVYICSHCVGKSLSKKWTLNIDQIYVYKYILKSLSDKREKSDIGVENYFKIERDGETSMRR